MGGWIEITNHSSTDGKTPNGPVFSEYVTGWGVLAAATRSKKDWYHDDFFNNKDQRSTRANINFHFFCKKLDTEGTPTVLMVKLYPDPATNPSGYPLVSPATMAPTEHFAEWRVLGLIGTFSSSWLDIQRIPNDEIWYQSMPDPGIIDPPWRIIYNMFKYGWQPPEEQQP